MALNGCAVTIKLGTNDIAGINNITWDAVADMLDVTDFDSSCNREFLNGLRGTTMTISGDYEPGDTNGQVVLQNAFLNGTLLTTTAKPVYTVDGTNGFTGDAYVSAFSINPTVEGKVVISVTLQITGTVSIVS